MHMLCQEYTQRPQSYQKVVSSIDRAKEEEGTRYQSRAAFTPHGMPA